MNRRILLKILAALVLVQGLAVQAAFAVLPDEMLPDAGQEARAVALSKNLRCVVCQNQNIDDSAAPIARDMRLLLRERIAAGDTDDKAVAYLVQRYGNYVLLKPPFHPGTAILWLTPALVLLGGGAYLVLNAGKPKAAEDVLTEAEAAELAALVGQQSATLPPRTDGNTPAGEAT